MSRRRRPNPRLVKIHRNYTVDEVARTLGSHKNTVRSWIKQGLPTIDSRRPTLIHGLDVARFLETRRKAGKQSCGPGQIYCVKCRSPKSPAGGMVDYVSITATSGKPQGDLSRLRDNDPPTRFSGQVGKCSRQFGGRIPASGTTHKREVCSLRRL